MSDERGYTIEITDLKDNSITDGQLTHDLSVASQARFRLLCKRGQWSADPDMGSRFFSLKNLKGARENALSYAKEALQPLIDDNRITSVSIGDIGINPISGLLAVQIFIDTPGETMVDLGSFQIGVYP